MAVCTKVLTSALQLVPAAHLRPSAHVAPTLVFVLSIEAASLQGMCRAVAQLAQCLCLAIFVVTAWVAIPSDIFVGICLVPLFVLIARSWGCRRATVRWRSRLLGEFFVEVSSLDGGCEAVKQKEKKKAPTPSPKAIARVTAPSRPRARYQDACPVCGSPMVQRRAHEGGKFWGCSTWPECDATRKFSDPYIWNMGPENRARRARTELSGATSVQGADARVE